MKTQFSLSEANAINKLLTELQRQDDASSNAAKLIRNKLRKKYGYYISQFNTYLPSGQEANCVTGFHRLIEIGIITISEN